MSRLATDRDMHRLLRDFIIAVNRLDNAEAREADPSRLEDLGLFVRTAAEQVEQALVDRGWSKPGARVLRVVDTVDLTRP